MSVPMHPDMRPVNLSERRVDENGLPVADYAADWPLFDRVVVARAHRRILKPHLADTLALYARGYGYGAVAHLLGVSESAIRERVARGLTILGQLEAKAA